MHSSRAVSKRAAAGACAVLATTLVVAGGATSSAAPASRPAATSRCPTSGLVVWLDTQSNGTLGHVTYKLRFTNLTGHACTLRGFPGVSAVALNGHQLGSAAVRDTTSPPRLVHLGRGATATALLRIT